MMGGYQDQGMQQQQHPQHMQQQHMQQHPQHMQQEQQHTGYQPAGHMPGFSGATHSTPQHAPHGYGILPPHIGTGGMEQHAHGDSAPMRMQQQAAMLFGGMGAAPGGMGAGAGGGGNAPSRKAAIPEWLRQEILRKQAEEAASECKICRVWQVQPLDHTGL